MFLDVYLFCESRRKFIIRSFAFYPFSALPHHSHLGGQCRYVCYSSRSTFFRSGKRWEGLEECLMTLNYPQTLNFPLCRTLFLIACTHSQMRMWKHTTFSIEYFIKIILCCHQVMVHKRVGSPIKTGPLGLLYTPHMFVPCQRAFLADVVHWKTICLLGMVLRSAASVLFHSEMYGMT